MNITSALNAALECVASMATATEHRESTIRELQRTIEDRNTTIYAAKRVNDTLSSEVAGKDATIRELKSKGRSHDAQCSKNTTAIGMIHDLHDTIDELQATITKLEKEINTLEAIRNNDCAKIRELRKDAMQESPEEIRLHQTIKELQNRNDTQAVDISKLNAYINKHTKLDKTEKVCSKITLRKPYRNIIYRGIVILHIKAVFDVDYDEAMRNYNGLISGDAYIGDYNAHLVDSDLLDCQAFSLPT